MPPTILTKKDGTKRLTWLLPNVVCADMLQQFLDEVDVFAVVSELKDGFARVTVNYAANKSHHVDFAVLLFERWFEPVVALNKCLEPKKEPPRGRRRPQPKAT